MKQVAKVKTLIFLFVKRNNSSFLKSAANDKGFSLIEILVSLFLVVAILTITTIGSNPSREKLDESLYLMERAVRFANDEAVLRNTITRIHFFFDKDPQEMAVEYGPNSDFILPMSLTEESDIDDLSESENKKRNGQNSKLSSNFNKVKEFQEDNKEIGDSIKLVAMATTLNSNIFTTNEAAMYVYPNGEKDGVMIVLASYDELASFSVEPFNLEFKYKYYPIGIEFVDEEEREEYVYNKAKEIISNWMKN